MIEELNSKKEKEKSSCDDFEGMRDAFSWVSTFRVYTPDDKESVQSDEPRVEICNEIGNVLQRLAIKYPSIKVMYKLSYVSEETEMPIK